MEYTDKLTACLQRWQNQINFDTEVERIVAAINARGGCMGIYVDRAMVRGLLGGLRRYGDESTIPAAGLVVFGVKP